MSIYLVIEKNKLVWKSSTSDWRKDVTPEEYAAFQFGIKKGQELTALKVQQLIEELEVRCCPEHPLCQGVVDG